MISSGNIRLAEEGDVEAILDIYGPLVEKTPISFEYEVPDRAEFWSRILHNLKSRPWLVCQINGAIAGYAYASQHRARSGYDWCSEVSVYTGPGFKRRGVARALYTALLEILGSMGYRNAYAVITLPNAASVSFHQSMGFQHLTVYRDVGFKLGSWHDVDWWHYEFPKRKSPSFPVPFAQALESAFYRTALEKGAALLIIK